MISRNERLQVGQVPIGFSSDLSLATGARLSWENGPARYTVDGVTVPDAETGQLAQDGDQHTLASGYEVQNFSAVAIGAVNAQVWATIYLDTDAPDDTTVQVMVLKPMTEALQDYKPGDVLSLTPGRAAHLAGLGLVVIQ